MRTSILRVAALAAFTTLFAAGIANAAQPLLPAGASDQVPQRLAVLPAPGGAIERKPVAFSWALDPDAALADSAPFLAESREYWMTVEDTELRRGVPLRTTAPGALIRISPATGSAGLRAGDFSVSAGARKVGIAQAADAEALRKAGMDASAGTQVIRLGDGSGAGRQLLRAANARGRYVVHVFEPTSDRVLFARADRNHALAGNRMRVAIGATDAGRRAGVASQALLVAPDGSSQPVTVSDAAGGGQEAVFTVPASAGTAQGLWELQVFGEVGDVPRDARTAFAVAQPTARFAGLFGVDAANLRVSLPVEAASPGRYEAHGTLYATAKDGSLRPVSQAHAAAWMDAGDGMLVLQFARTHLPAGYGAPFEVRHLELNDQGRMAPIEARERGARF
ncbi:MAG TPA: DUF4785 domain-containing protein [Thermomonas sp.]|nr:DUF4785 domain-containing protein [Thermomonas sp.]